MNIDWDQQLREYFEPKDFKHVQAFKKLSDGQYQFITLEGQKIKFSCSGQGYQSLDDKQVYQSFENLLRARSPMYAKKFNEQLNKRLKYLSQQ